MKRDDPAAPPRFLRLDRMRWSCALLATFAFAPSGAAAILSMPDGASRTAQIAEPLGSDTQATGAYRPDGAQLRSVDGRLVRTAWRIRGSEATTLQVMAPLRAQLTGAGYDIVFECDTARCGGFDFRYDLSVISEPEMHVDLGDFRYLAADKTLPTGVAHVMLLVSRSSESAFVQITEVTPYDPKAVTVSASSKSPDPVSLMPAPASPTATTPAPAPDIGKPDLAASLDLTGQVALDDLIFPSGSTDLGPGDFASLAAIAAYLDAHPDRAITLVGHTDAVGTLAVNVAISRKRAQSVVDRLISAYGVKASQLSAQGIGYLAPRASNLTDEGRTENRRVEAILTSTR